MSSVTLARSDEGSGLENDVSEQSTYISVSVQEDIADKGYQAAWSGLNASLRRSLQRAGFPQPDEIIEERGVPETWTIVAPGIMMRTNEYQERFSGIDLDSFKQKMDPKLFAAFVRHLGTVSGRDDLDIDELSQIPEVR